VTRSNAAHPNAVSQCNFYDSHLFCLQVVSLQADARPKRGGGKGTRDWANSRAATSSPGAKDGSRVNACARGSTPSAPTEGLPARSSTAGGAKEEAGAPLSHEHNRRSSREVWRNRVSSIGRHARVHFPTHLQALQYQKAMLSCMSTSKQSHRNICSLHVAPHVHIGGAILGAL
jgi:hypothetical protein